MESTCCSQCLDFFTLVIPFLCIFAAAAIVFIQREFWESPLVGPKCPKHIAGISMCLYATLILLLGYNIQRIIVSPIFLAGHGGLLVIIVCILIIAILLLLLLQHALSAWNFSKAKQALIRLQRLPARLSGYLINPTGKRTIELLEELLGLLKEILDLLKKDPENMKKVFGEEYGENPGEGITAMLDLLLRQIDATLNSDELTDEEKEEFERLKREIEKQKKLIDEEFKKIYGG